MLSAPQTAAMVQTTFATTQISGGFAANALPREAQATVNIRLLPGVSTDEILKTIIDAIDDPRVEVTVDGQSRPASDISPTEGKPYATVERLAAGLSTSDQIVVSPFLFIAGTDSKHYSRISRSVYRFSGMNVTGSDLERVHGVDESISIDALMSSIRFYYHFVRIEAMSSETPN
jgi:carboxypeptidase PM20D1